MNYLKLKFVKSVYKKEDIIKDDIPIIVLVGKSNVGKSSFINALSNNKNTAKVGSTPGKTRCINYFLSDNDCYIVDLPGYGYSTMSLEEKNNINKLTNYFLEFNLNIKHIFFLLDIRHMPSNEDKNMYDWLVKKGLPFTIILNKSDKLSKLKIEEAKKEICKNLFAKEEMIDFSSETKNNLDKVMSEINKFKKES